MSNGIENLIVILGHANDLQGKLSEIAISRLDAGVEVYHEEQRPSILLTGGFGEHFNQTKLAHAFYAKKYLSSNNILSESILNPFILSSNTIEDGLFAKPVIEDIAPKQVFLITSEFHMPRALFIFQRELRLMKIKGCPSHSPISPSILVELSAHESRQLSRLKQEEYRKDNNI